MSTIIDMTPLQHGEEKHGFGDDFLHGTSVAGAHVNIRLGFLRKVYGILSAQLLFTTLVGILCMSVEPVQTFLKGNQWVVFVSAIAALMLVFPLMLKSREVPINYYLLALFTLFESILIGSIVIFYEVEVVIKAFALTCAVTVGLTVYTFQSKRDFSSWGMGLFAVLWVLIITGFLQIFIQSEMMDLALSAGGAILFSLFIIFDTYMVMHKVSPEEYIHASINLYLDIINLFLHLLRLMGEANRR